MTGSRGAAVAAALATASGPLPARGAAATASVLDEPAGVAWEDGILTYVGPAGGLPWPASIGTPDRGLLVPGFVDCHVHLPFIGWRADEFEARLAGASYRDLHGEEGGIFRSSRMLAAASDDDVLAFCLPLTREMAAHGTTAMELKTGYGLSVEAELRQARLARALAAAAPQTCSVTLLACHAVPEGVDASRVGARRVRRADPRRRGRRARRPGRHLRGGHRVLARRPHGRRRGGGARRAPVARPRRSARSERRGGGRRRAGRAERRPPEPPEPRRRRRRWGSRTAPSRCCCPRPRSSSGRTPRRSTRCGAPAPPSPSRTDFNPGTSPVSSMPEAIAFACSSYGLRPLEALTAATANPAFVLGMDDRLGHAGGRQARRRPAAGGAVVRAGALPAGPRPGGRDDRRRGARRMIIWLNGPFGVGQDRGRAGAARGEARLGAARPRGARGGARPEMAGRRRLPGPAGMAESRRGGRRRAGGHRRPRDPHDDLAAGVLPRDHGRAEGRRRRSVRSV